MRRIVLALCLMAVAAWGMVSMPTDAKAASEAMMVYHRKPSPDGIAEMLRGLDTMPFGEGQVAPVAGFFFEVFRANPERLEAWRADILKLRQVKFQATLLLAMQAAAPGTREAIQKSIFGKAKLVLAMGVPSKWPTQQRFLAGAKVDPDFNWGRFLATGKAEYVHNVIRIACTQIAPKDGSINLTAYAARWSLLAMSQQQPEVAAILVEYFKTAPDAEVHFFFDNVDQPLREKLLGKERAAKLPPPEKPKKETHDSAADENPFKGFFDEECFRRQKEGKELRLTQLEELLREDSPASAPADIKLFLDCFYRGMPMPRQGGEIPRKPADDFWAEMARAMRLFDAGRGTEAEAALEKLRHGGGTALCRTLLLDYISKGYPRNSKERKQCEKDLLGAVEAAVREGRWKGRICYLWYYNDLSFNVKEGQRFWGELETRLKPVGAQIDPWFWEMVQGRADIFWAWSQRGGGWASTVTREGWDGFGRHLRSARTHFHKALELHPEWANPHIQLITVEMGDGDTEAVIRELKAVLSIDPTNSSAMSKALWALLPRWGGSHELIRQLAMEAMKCPRRDSGVPAMGYQCLVEIAYDYGGYGWQKVYLDPEVKEQATRLFQEYQAGMKKWDFLYYRLWHELAELRYDDAAKTLQELGGEAAFRARGGLARRSFADSKLGTAHYDDCGLRIRLFTGKFGGELRRLERELLDGRRDGTLAEVRALLEKRALPADEQEFLLEWYARWKMDFSPSTYPSVATSRGGTFTAAVRNEQTEVVQEMLRFGYDWKAHENYPGELAQIIVAKCKDPAMLKLLQDAGDPLDRQKPDSGYAPIHTAAAHGAPVMVEALLDAGIGIETRCRDGHTPLQTAAVMMKAANVQTLLKRGADPNAQDGDGDTCLIYLPQVRARPEVYRALLADPRTDVNLANHAGETPLHLMAKWNTRPEIVEMLLAKGAELNARNHRGYTPLDVAQESGNAELAQFLRAKGAKTWQELPPLPKAKTPSVERGGQDWLVYAPWIGGAVAVLALLGCVFLVARRRGRNGKGGES